MSDLYTARNWVKQLRKQMTDIGNVLPKELKDDGAVAKMYVDALDAALADLMVGQGLDPEAEMNTDRSYSDAASGDSMFGFSVGERVKVKGTVKPQYLAGAEGEVTGFGRKKIQVSFDDNPKYRRFQNAKNVSCPSTILEKIERSPF